MESIGIDTTQNVRIKQQRASLGRRMLATLVDFLVIFGYVVVVNLTFELGGGNIDEGLGMLSLLPVLVYFPLLEIGMKGQTIGKASLSIRVIKLDGTAPGMGAYLMRWLLGLVEYYLSLGGIAALAIIFSRNNQRLGDLAAGTTVILNKKIDRAIKQSLAQSANVSPEHEPNFPSAYKLDDQDIRLANRAIRAFRKNGQRAPMEKLKTKLEEKMQIPPQERLHPMKFLLQVIDDHHYFSQRQEV